MAADIGHLDLDAAAKRGVKVQFLHPQTQEPIADDTFVRVYGCDSDEWKKFDRELRAQRENPFSKMNESEHEQHLIKVLAKCTFEVSGLIIEGVTYTPENILEAYTKKGFHFLWEQALNEAMSRRGLDLGKKH